MDLFERLQDELLIHVISFLPTKHAILTSVLSKRWKFLWCFANKSLAFDDSVSYLPAFHEDVGYYGLDLALPFQNFVDRSLKLINVSQLDSFFLKMYTPRHLELSPVHSWLDHIVTTRQAKEIQLHFSTLVCYTLSCVSFPLETFNSASLRVLKLYFGGDRPLKVSNNSTRFFLPNLNILHFWMNGIANKLWIFKSLFRAAPQLEEAYIGGDLRKSKIFCNIYAPSLKRLRIRFLRSIESSNKFLINAPILEELFVVDALFQHYVIKSNCLVNAKLDIGSSHVRKYQELHTHIYWVCKLLRRISNVKLLNLRAHTMDALSIYCSRMHCNLPQFTALRQLKLCFLNYTSWDVIPKLLERASNLEVLVISKDFKGKDAQFKRDSVWIQPSSVPVCLLSTLRQVEMRDCESHQVEFNLINYLLDHGNVLSTFLVELLPAELRDDLVFKEKLMLIPRVSKTCDLKISVYPLSFQHRDFSTDEGKICHLAKLQQRMPPQKTCFEDLRVSTDYFSSDHLMTRTKEFKLYRGKLYQSSASDSPVTDVVVKKWVIRAQSPYNEHKENSMCIFREELKLLEHPNVKCHPYFTSLLGYCAEDNNERLGMVYDFKPLDCLKNLIPKDSFKWPQRIKVALVLACILEYMHKKHEDLPSVTARICPSSVILDENYMPAVFNFKRRHNYFREEDDNVTATTMYDESRSDFDVCSYGITLLGLISKRVHRCPSGRYHTDECRTMDRFAQMQANDRQLSSSLCKSQTPLVHKNLMDDSTYDIVDGLKITRLAMWCVDSPVRKPSMHAIVKYLCKLRVVRENWVTLDYDKIIGEHLNKVLVS